MEIQILFLLWPLSLLVLVQPTHALDPAEILVVVNDRMPESVSIGKYYLAKREIPNSHLLKLSTSTKEVINRTTYESEIKNVIAKKIIELNNNAATSQKPRIAAIVTIYGVPLKVVPNKPSSKISKEVEGIRSKIGELNKNKDTKTTDSARIKKSLKRKIEILLKTNTRAAVDSELALVTVENNPLEGWVPNPFYLGNQGRKLDFSKNDVLLVSRLDGPSPDIVRRIVDDTLSAEKSGLNGKAYFDARGLVNKNEDPNKLGNGYKYYDYSIRRASQKVKDKGLEVVLDQNAKLFQVGDCPNAALYCGWYSLANYVDSFEWVEGAIGYHIASSECASLRTMIRQFWCPRMLEKGAAATIGPVFEPYVQAFPVPELFFGLLVDGYMSLGEAYLVSLPVLSWQMVLVGDPLYQPFIKHQKVQ